MDSIKVLRKHLASIEETDSKRDNTFEIELLQIDKMAKQTPFKGHFISEYDEDIIQRYIIFLASVVRELSDVEKRIKQYYFISRLAHGMPGNIKVSDWITKAELVELADIEGIRDAIGSDSVLMAFDILLMISLDGKIEEKQMQYFCEILAYLSIDKKVIDVIVRACSLILIGEEEKVLDFADKISVSKLSCYFKNPIIGEVVSSVDGLKKSKNTDVVVVGVGFKNEELDIDNYNKKNIVFRNCKFENIASLRANNTKVIFNSCMFDRCCKQGEGDGESLFGFEFGLEDDAKLKSIFDYALISMKNAEFIGCSFEKCGQEYVNPISIFIGLEQGKISECIFKECYVNTNATRRKRYRYSDSTYYYEYAAFIYTGKVTINDCKFITCSSYGNGKKPAMPVLGLGKSERLGAEYEYLDIVHSNGGSIEKCEFHNCSCDGRTRDGIKRFNQIINKIGAMDKDNKFVKCNVTNVGSEKWENVNI